MKFSTIRTEEEYKAALEFVSPLFDSPPQDESELERHFTETLQAICAYEEEHYPLDSEKSSVQNRNKDETLKP